jgi:hypothetical protein
VGLALGDKIADCSGPRTRKINRSSEFENI